MHFTQAGAAANLAKGRWLGVVLLTDFAFLETQKTWQITHAEVVWKRDVLDVPVVPRKLDGVSVGVSMLLPARGGRGIPRGSGSAGGKGQDLGQLGDTHRLRGGLWSAPVARPSALL